MAEIIFFLLKNKEKEKTSTARNKSLFLYTDCSISIIVILEIIFQPKSITFSFIHSFEMASFFPKVGGEECPRGEKREEGGGESGRRSGSLCSKMSNIPSPHSSFRLLVRGWASKKSKFKKDCRFLTLYPPRPV